MFNQIVPLKPFAVSSASRARVPGPSALLPGVLLALALFTGNSLAATGELAVLRVGVFPYLSTRVMLTTFEPLRDYLETSLQRSVRFYTAANYRDYYSKAINGDYDVAIFPPHLALLAQRDGAQTPIARFSRVMHGVFVTTSESPITSLGQMRGAHFATPDSLALVSILAVRQLLSVGLVPSRDFIWRPGASHYSALLNLRRGTAQVALVADSALEQMPSEQREDLRILARTSEFPSLIVMARRTLPIRTRNAVQAALLAWDKEATGREQMAALKFGEIVPVVPSDLEPLNVYLPATLEALQAPDHEAARHQP